jgi:hypothetical protein
MRTLSITTILFLSFFSTTLNAQTDQFGKPVAAPLLATNAEVTVSNQTIQTLGLFEVLGIKEIGIVVKDTIKIRPKVPGTWTVDAKGVATFMTFTDFVVAPGTRGVILKDGVVKNGNTISEFRVCVHPPRSGILVFYIYRQPRWKLPGQRHRHYFW